MKRAPKLSVVKGERPILRAYLSRVGAREKNFRRHVIEEEDASAYIGGKRVVAEIKIGTDGTITCDKQHAPTDDEQKAIKADVAKAPFPKSINARKGQLPPQLKNVDEKQLCIFLSLTGKEILFVQQRRDDPKRDLPFSFWSDGIWRNMEPDGLLPLYGLERLKDAAVVFLHEGAKGARDVQALTDEGRAHPWSDELRGAAHIGWPGGAERPHGVDWSPIKRLAPHVRVTVVCDHDQPGEDAARGISRTLQRALSTVRFGNAFPRGFDLADQFPDELWKDKKGNRIYVGPSFEDCLSPATWATYTVPPEGKGAPRHELRDQFAQEWAFSIKPAAFVNRRDPRRRYSKDEFNTLVAPYADVDDVARLLCKRPSSAAETLSYEPGEKSGLIAVGRRHVINVYQPSDIKPRNAACEPWLGFMAHLIPNDDDRANLMKWIATLIARPDVRMTFAVLLVSELQGVGKTTLAEKIVMPLVGKHNCSFPSAHEVTQKDFSSWRVFKRLAVIAELYDGETARAYNRLKGAITDEWIRCEEKYEKPFDVKNQIHILASSNSKRALKLSGQDRRWFMPGVTETKWPTKNWVELNLWLADGGLNAICAWAHEYVEAHGHVATGIEAPDSSTKTESIYASMSDGEKLVHDLGKNLVESEDQIIVRLDEVRSWLSQVKSGDARYGDGTKYLETPETISAVLRRCGLKISTKRFKKDAKRFLIASNFEIDEQATWAALGQRCVSPASAAEMGKGPQDELI